MWRAAKEAGMEPAWNERLVTVYKLGYRLEVTA